LDVHEQVVVLVAALFGREARAVLLAVADVGRLPGSVV
jgi:pyrimidine operon attenuation protein/uracil phosphoribosyltransferase